MRLLVVEMEQTGKLLFLTEMFFHHELIANLWPHVTTSHPIMSTIDLNDVVLSHVGVKVSQEVELFLHVVDALPLLLRRRDHSPGLWRFSLFTSIFRNIDIHLVVVLIGDRLT